MLALLAAGGGNLWVPLADLFGVGLTMMVAIPTIQVHLTRVAPEAPTLMGAMNLAALNVANAIGTVAVALTRPRRHARRIALATGYELLSAVWAALGLTFLGLLVFAVRPAPRRARSRRRLPVARIRT